MELLGEIKDGDYSLHNPDIKMRKAARAILFDDQDLMPLLFVEKFDYYKIPGGGIEGDESTYNALIRECREEVGCEIDVLGEVGKTQEYRHEWNEYQKSYCYYGKIVSKGLPNFSEKEIKSGFRVIWVILDDAIRLVKNAKPKNYAGRHNQKRDTIFLEKMKEIKTHQ